MSRERACAAPSMPPGLADAVAGYCWSRDAVGESGAYVYRLHGATDRPDLYLKHGRGESLGHVSDEMTRLRWLSGHVPVPAVRHFVLNPQETWLLTEAISGRSAFELLAADHEADAAEKVVDALAEFLRRLHAVPIDLCPFNSDHALRLARAHDRMISDLVDTDDFDDERYGWTARQVWDAMMALLPFDGDPVVTHGDYSLDNLLMDGFTVSACIDVDRVGIADRYQDVAIMWNCLREFGPVLQDRFLHAYGIADVDRRKLHFHLMLDEFF